MHSDTILTFEPWTKGSTERTSATPDTKTTQKPPKKHPLDVANKCVETYSSSHAAAQYPEESVN